MVSLLSKLSLSVALIIVPVFYQQRGTGYSRAMPLPNPMHHMCYRTYGLFANMLMEWTPSYPSCTKGFYKLGYNCSASSWAGYAYHLWTVLTWRAAQYRSCSPTIEPRGFSLVLWRGQQNVIVCFEMDIFDTLSSFWIQVQLYVPWIFEARSSRGGVGVG